MANDYLGAEVVLGYDFIAATLLADADVIAIIGDRVYQDVAPASAIYPFIVIQNQLSDDMLGVGSVRIYTDTIFIVKAVAQVDTYDPLRPLAKAIDVALNGVTGSVLDGTVFACIREESFRLAETEEGVHHKNLGGSYRLQLQG